MLERDPSEFFEWVKFRSHLSRGVMIGTMLKDEAFHFARMGTFLERADNTARLLDVKYHGMAELGRLVEPTSVERSDAKAGDAGRVARRLLLLGRGAAVGVGVRDLSQGVSAT